MYVTSSLSIRIASFEGDQRRRVTGLQALAVGSGGILLSIIGGILVEIKWFYSYAFMMVALAIAFYAIYAIPKGAGAVEKIEGDHGVTTKRSKFNVDILYYVLCQFLLFFFYLVCNHNISVHLANSGVRNFSVAAGFASGIAMAGSVTFSSFFKQLSRRFGDMLIVIGFLLQALG